MHMIAATGLVILLKLDDITGINPEAVLWWEDHYEHPLCPGLKPGPPSQTPGGSGPEVLKRERGHVTSDIRVSEVGVFRALQPNEIVEFSALVTLKFDGSPPKTIGHLLELYYVKLCASFQIHRFKQDLQSGNAQFGSKLPIFLSHVTLKFGG